MSFEITRRSFVKLGAFLVAAPTLALPNGNREWPILMLGAHTGQTMRPSRGAWARAAIASAQKKYKNEGYAPVVYKFTDIFRYARTRVIAHFLPTRIGVTKAAHSGKKIEAIFAEIIKSHLSQTELEKTMTSGMLSAECWVSPPEIMGLAILDDDGPYPRMLHGSTEVKRS